MKLVIEGKKGITISEFKANELIQSIDEKEKLTLKKYELLRTEKQILFQTNKRTRTKNSIKIMRLCALLAKERDCKVMYDKEKGIIQDNAEKEYIIADCVNSEEEHAFHLNKTNYQNREVISLTKSKHCRWFNLDNKSLIEYYKHYEFPKWFKPFIKMRHFRFMLDNSSFSFQTRKYNTSSKHTCDEKFRHDLLQTKKVAKCYFSLARYLDVKLEKIGKGYPIDLMYLVLDVDGHCEGNHLINEKGICVKCLCNANESLEKVKNIIKDIPEFSEGYFALFSGSKGYHIHPLKPKEISNKRMIEIVSQINGNEKLVDDFTFERNGIKTFDFHRIFKIPFSIDMTTACLVSHMLERLPVEDKIMEPQPKSI